MRRIIVLSACVIFWADACVAQSSAAQTAAAPQTARQALLEMFFSKTPGTFARHLPAVTLAALEKSGAMASLQQYSLLTAQMQTQQALQTFETGPVLLSGVEQKTGQRIDITVVNETARADEDDIELSFRTYKNGEAQRTPYMPQLTFTMKQEEQVWKLNEISITIHLPLADPELLKAVTEKMKPQPQLQSATFAPHGDSPVQMQAAGSDAMAISAMRTILAAENTYTRTYTTVGYTCTLSSLDGFGGGEPNEHQAMLISSGLASGKKYGFVFTLSGCSGAPAASFHLTAAPNGNSFGRKAFCSDQSGTIRSSDDGNVDNCLAHGSPVQ